MAIDPFLGTEFEHDFFIVDRDAESAFMLPGHLDECRVIADAESTVLGYIRDDAADVVVRVLNQSWHDAEKRRELLYRMAQVALATDQDLCDENDLVEDFEEIIAGRR